MESNLDHRSCPGFRGWSADASGQTCDDPADSSLETDSTLEADCTLEIGRELASHHAQSFGWALACCSWDRDAAEDVLQSTESPSTVPMSMVPKFSKNAASAMFIGPSDAMPLGNESVTPSSIIKIPPFSTLI